MHSLHRGPLAVAILAAALTSAPAFAQSRPEKSDSPKATGIRVPVLRSGPSTLKPDTISGTATIHPVNADSIASQMNTSVLVRVPAWQQEQERELDLDDGSRRATFVERLGFAAAFTAVGAGLGYSWWHTCNDPESDVIWSCIVAPRRLGTSVRFGAYSGLLVGLAGLVGDLRVVKGQKLFRAAGRSLLFDHQARSGFRVGVNFRF